MLPPPKTHLLCRLNCAWNKRALVPTMLCWRMMGGEEIQVHCWVSIPKTVCPPHPCPPQPPIPQQFPCCPPQLIGPSSEFCSSLILLHLVLQTKQLKKSSLFLNFWAPPWWQAQRQSNDNGCFFLEGSRCFVLFFKIWAEGGSHEAKDSTCPGFSFQNSLWLLFCLFTSFFSQS